MLIRQTNQSIIVYPVDYAGILVIDRFNRIHMTGRIMMRWILDGHVSFLVLEVTDFTVRSDRRKSYVWLRKIFVLFSVLKHKCNSYQEVQQVQKVLVTFVVAETSSLDCLFNFLERVEVNFAPIRERPKVNTRIGNSAKFLIEHVYVESRWLHKVIQMPVVHTLFSKVQKQ